MISKTIRKEAALLAAVWASTPKGWDGEAWSEEAIELYSAAFKYVWENRVGGTIGTYRLPYDGLCHEVAAEASLLLEEGWSPGG